MHLPDFTASASLGRSKRTYHGKYRGAAQLAVEYSRVKPSQLEGDSSEDDAMARQSADAEVGVEEPGILEEVGALGETEAGSLEHTEAEDVEAEETTESG